MTLPAFRPTQNKYGDQEDAAGPSVTWLALGFLLSGLGTVLLGPILPAVTLRWQLSDASAGTLLFAKFLGAFAGGSTVPHRLRNGVFHATLFTAAGLLAFSISVGMWTAALSLALTGFGLGRLIASSNILAGRRYPAHTSSALARLNFFWSLGAVSTGVLVSWLLPYAGLRGLLSGIAGAFVVAGLGGILQVQGTGPHLRKRCESSAPLSRRVLVYFGVLLVLYGGLETALSSWLSTFDSRYMTRASLPGQTLLVLFWAALTAGRALAAITLRRWTERAVLRASLLCVVTLVVALATIHGNFAISATCLCLGLALAPWFPAAFGLLLQRNPGTREAGFILALSGIGAAVFPWLTGIVSTHADSLRAAMCVPASLAAILLCATFSPLTIRSPSTIR